MRIKSEVKVAGKYSIQVLKADGSVKHDTGWFDNLITDGGLDALATNVNFARYCQVGSGSTIPSNGDTALASRIASVDKGTGWCSINNSGAASSSPYYQYQRIVYTFSAGVATGNISEVGVGWASTGSLFSRALILDTYGNPTTITVLSDEQLIVTYEFRYYPIETDQTGSVTFSGNIGGTYNWTLRPALASTVKSQYVYPNTWYVAAPMSLATGYNSTLYAGTNSIAILTSEPHPSIGKQDISAAIGSYTAGTYTISLTLSASTSQANINIASMLVLWGPTCIQIGFSPAIPKTSSDTLSIVLTRSWGRY